jgi:CheY-like chemotaxis protein
VTSLKAKKKSSKIVGLRPGSKVVIVDDTPVNVKVLEKMMSRSTSVPIFSCFDGQSAVELVKSFSNEDHLLIMMDWHMPGVDGLTATAFIRRLVRDRGGPSVHVCMVTADLEGLCIELDRRRISYEGTVSMGKLIKAGDEDTSSPESTPEKRSSQRLAEKDSNGFTVVDIITGKPVTFDNIYAILTWFQEQIEGTEG